MTKPLTVVASLLLCALVVFAAHRSLGSVRRPELTIATVNNADVILSQQLSKDFEQQHGLKLNWVVLGTNALRQRLTIFEFLERLRRQDHHGTVFGPGLLSLDDVAADRFVTDEQPRFVEREDLESAERGRIANFIARPMEDIKEKWFKNLRRISLAGELKDWKRLQERASLGLSKRNSYCP